MDVSGKAGCVCGDKSNTVYLKERDHVKTIYI